MTWHNCAGRNQPRLEPVTAIRLRNVWKVYRLYASRREQIFDTLRLPRIFFGARKPPVQEFCALKDVNLEIRRGERIGVIGRNGAGKSTLLKLITGNFSPTSGEVEVNGTVQALLQMGLGFHPDFSGYENIRSALNYNGLSGEELEAAIEDVIDFVELGEFLHQPMKTYSLGMQSRLQFAAATAIKPDILIIDEILGAGDAYFSGKSSHRIQNLALSGCTLLLVSHSMSQVLQFCEKAVWLDRGEIRAEGDTLSVVRAYEEYIERISHEKRVHQDGRVRMTVQAVGQETTQRDFPTPEWQRDRFAALLLQTRGNSLESNVGDLISRWPGEPGLRVGRVGVLDEHGSPTGTVCQGQGLSFEVEMVAEKTGYFECRVVVLLMTLDGIAVTRHLSEVLTFDLEAGDRQIVRLHYAETQLAAGEFVFSVGLFKQYDPDDVTSAIRYEILSRSFRLKVIPKHPSEPAIFHHPAEWLVCQTIKALS